MPIHLTALILLAAPFYLNDFASIYIDDWKIWLSIDYLGVKLFPLLVILWLIRERHITAADLGLVRQPLIPFVMTFLLVALIGTVIDLNGYELIRDWPGYERLGAMPPITSKVWDWIDLTFGLLMVAAFEELVFRGYLRFYIGKFTDNPTIIVAISSIAFGLIHWCLGLHAVIITSIIGAVFMIAYLRTRSLPAIILAHFMVNFIDFAGVIPESIFRFYSLY